MNVIAQDFLMVAYLSAARSKEVRMLAMCDPMATSASGVYRLGCEA